MVLAVGVCSGAATPPPEGPASSPVSTSGLPCIRVADKVTADPANSAPRVRVVGRHERGEADEWATIQARSLCAVHNYAVHNPGT